MSQYLGSSHRYLRGAARQVLLRPALHSLLRVSVEGEENVADLQGAFIVVANHTSHLDAPIIFACLPAHLTKNLATGAAADYFYRKPAISKITSLFFNTYPVDRRPRPASNSNANPANSAGLAGSSGSANPANSAGLAGSATPARPAGSAGPATSISSGSARAAGDIKAGSGSAPAKRGMSVRLLESGVPLLIFPEGTRSRTGQMGKFKPGTAALSIKLRVPIVPVAMIGNHQAMPVGAKFPRLGRHDIRVVIGRPMRPVVGETVEDFNRRVETRVRIMVEMPPTD